MNFHDDLSSTRNVRYYNLTIIREIYQAYKQSPFFYWFIFLLIINVTNWSPFEQFKTALWVNQLWIAIFFPLFITHFFIILKVKAIHESSKQYKGKKSPIVIICMTVPLLLVSELPLFFIGIIEIMASQHPEIIINQIKFKQNIIAGMIIEFIIPLTSHYLLYPTRKFFNEKFFQKTEFDSKDELEISLSFIWMSFWLSLIVVQILNYHAYGRASWL